MKISKRIAAQLEQIQNDANWSMNIAARKKANDETLPNYFDKPPEYYLGMAQGKYSVLSSLLHVHNSYQGFAANTIEVNGLPVIGYETESYYMPVK